LGQLYGTASFGYGNYHGMTAMFEKRYSDGLQLMASYTFGDAHANTGTTLSGATGFGIPDPRNYASGYSLAAWNIRHNFISSFSYDIPFGRGRKWGSSLNRAADIVAGGWQINGILTLHTGNPYTVRWNGCQGVWNACRPDLVSGKDPDTAPAAGRTPDQWFDTTVVANAAALTGGNFPLNSMTKPPTRMLDFSLFKDFPITERWRVQFRAEATNLANTPQFGYPSNNKQNANFGQITSTDAGTERHIQFQLRLQF
jgi:hypothetical protein